ncbi:MAG: ATP-binding protein [Coriobacteriia bacterium]|nr:ATP-binding protein [Coriobacteriia bacterium]
MTGRLKVLTASYRARLALGYALVVVVLFGAWAWSLFGPVTQVVVEQQRSHLQTIAQASALAIQQTADPAQEVRRLVARTNLRITVVASDGRVIADSAQDPAKMENHGGRPEIVAALSGTVGSDTRQSATLGIPQMYVAVPAIVLSQTAALRVSEPVARVEALASRARQSGILLLLAAIAAAVIVGVRLSASAAEPVVRLKSAAEAMARGDLLAPVPEVSGELGGLGAALVTLRDTMRRTITGLEAEEATLRNALDGLQNAVFLFDAGRISVANSGAAAMFKTPAGGWAGKTPAEAALPASLRAAIEERLGCTEPCSTEIGPDPEHRYLRIAAIPLNPTDAGSRTLVVVEDTTEGRRLDRVRRDFVANASHELKTPTSSIQLLADSADTAASDGDTEQALIFVSQIKNEADRLRRLVLDLLDLSRLEGTPSPGSITDLRAAVDNALAGHQAAAAAAGLTLEADDTDVAAQDVYAAADPTDVAVAIDNLLANAIAYTDAGRVTMRLSADEQTTVVQITDTGVGIPAEHLPRIFERFYRVDPARTRASGGTGLGLALVKNAAERAGGSVEVTSVPGEGTTFTLRLPRAH